MRRICCVPRGWQIDTDVFGYCRIMNLMQSITSEGHLMESFWRTLLIFVFWFLLGHLFFVLSLIYPDHSELDDIVWGDFIWRKIG